MKYLATPLALLVAIGLTVIGFTALEVACALTTLRAVLDGGTELDVDL